MILRVNFPLAIEPLAKVFDSTFFESDWWFEKIFPAGVYKNSGNNFGFAGYQYHPGSTASSFLELEKHLVKFIQLLRIAIGLDRNIIICDCGLDLDTVAQHPAQLQIER